MPGSLAISGNVLLFARDQIATSSAVTINTGGGLYLDGNSNTIGSLADGTTTGGLVDLDAGTLTIGGSSTTTFSGDITGTGNVTLSGPGVLTLAGNSTQTGNTTINAGTLIVNGSTQSGTGSGTAVTVNSGGSLGGTGTIAGALNVNSGGTVSPGSPLSSIGTLTVGSADFSGGGTLVLQVAGYSTPGTSFDQLDVTGALTLGGTSSVTFDVSGNTLTGTADGLAVYGSESGAFTTVSLINNPLGLVANPSYTATSFNVVFTNTPPTANPQNITLPDDGETTITLTGSDIITPSSELVYTLTSLPSSGSLYQSNGSAATVGVTFTGSAAVLTYLLPTEVLGSLSTSFTFSVTDNGDPDGNSSNQLTSSATVSLQTPANSNGILRIGGGLGNDTFSLSETNSSNNLHVVVNGSAAGTDIPFSAITAIEVFGRNGTNTYTIPAGLPVPITVTGGTTSASWTTGPDNVTFNSGGGSATATVNLDSNAGTATLSPTLGTIQDGSNTITLNNMSMVTVNGNSNDTASLTDSSGSNNFTGAQTFAIFKGTGFYNRDQRVRLGDEVQAASGTTDSASLYDASGSNTFTATPTAASFTGTGLSETANGFANVYAYAASGTTDTATLNDASGS